jgi:hypothetical protein
MRTSPTRTTATAIEAEAGVKRLGSGLEFEPLRSSAMVTGWLIRAAELPTFPRPMDARNRSPRGDDIVITTTLRWGTLCLGLATVRVGCWHGGESGACPLGLAGGGGIQVQDRFPDSGVVGAFTFKT